MAKNLTRIDFDVEMRRDEFAVVVSQALPLSPGYVLGKIRVVGKRYVYQWTTREGITYRFSTPRSSLLDGRGLHKTSSSTTGKQSSSEVK